MAAKLMIVIPIVAAILTLAPLSLNSSQGFINSDPDPRKAPTAVSGDNIYIAWSSNKTGNEEVMFRVSNDSGKTFSDKLNLSNSPNSHSDRVEIAADGKNVIVTWWETNETTQVPVAQISNDFGKTFGSLLELGTNGIMGTGEVKPII
jgi:hypothetical protein